MFSTRVTTLAAVVAVAAAHFAGTATAKAGIIALYDFDGASPLAAKDVDPNATAGAYTTTAIGAFSSTTRTHFVNSPDLTITLSEVATFSVQADSGFTLNLDKLEFSYSGDHSQATSQTYQYAVYSSVDAYTSQLFFDEVTATRNADATTYTWTESASIDLSDPSFQNLNDITFSIRFSSTSNTTQDRLRIVTTNSSSNPQNWTGETDIVLYGTVVPEPSALALLGLGMIALLGFGRRRRSTSNRS